MNQSKKVILWGREDLLSRAVEVFLSTRKEWVVIRIAETFSLGRLMRELERVNPDVVILYQGDCASELHIPAQLLHGRPGLKVITVSLENNSIEVYNQQKVWVKQVADLLSVVETNFPSTDRPLPTDQDITS